MDSLKRRMGTHLDALAGSRNAASEWLFRASQRYLLSYLASGEYRASRNGEDALIRALARQHGEYVVIDVGANVGDWAAAVRRVIPSARIYCVEAAPETAAVLEARLQGDPLTSVHCTALSDRPETLQFRYFPDRKDISTVVMRNDIDTTNSSIIQLNATSGANFCRLLGIERVDLLKVDCEGHDLLVLRGFEGILASAAVVQFEHNDFGMRTGVHLDHFRTLLGATHDVGRLTRSGVLFSDRHSDWIGEFLPGNFVGVNKRMPQVKKALERF